VGQSEVAIVQYNAELEAIIGKEQTYSCLLSSAETSMNQFFHGGCIFVPEHDELYITSSLLRSTSQSQLPVILISKIKFSRDASGDITSLEWWKLRPPPQMPMPAGATRHEAGIVYCSQGALSGASGGLYYMPRGRPPVPVVTGYYGRSFNSVHDVVEAKDGCLWFTDPCHGFELQIRVKPQLPCHVYRYNPATGDLRVMAQDIGRPHCLAFAPDEKTLYVTDIDAIRLDGSVDLTR
jgi:gluconolactonase